MEFFYLGFMKINWSLLLNREVTLKYNQAVYQLKKELLDALSESLGLPTSLLDDVCGEGQNTNMIYYPPCPEPSNAFGVKPHSDPNTITILTQDEVGGLEVREKHGEWIQVKPTPYAFIVNVGDQLEVRV
jgi:isopenicillin N synthase-like dioxygenase